MEVVIKPQGQIDHLDGFGDDLGAAAEARPEMANVAVVLLDGKGQVFAGEERVLGDEAMETLPIVGDEGLAFEANFVDELLAGLVITATQHPGDGSPRNRVIGPPNPELASLFLRKCHISSSVMSRVSLAPAGSGS